MKMDLHEVVQKLTGPIAPIGDSNADLQRHRNMAATIDLVDRLVFALSEVASIDSYEESVKQAAENARKFLGTLRQAIPSNYEV